MSTDALSEFSPSPARPWDRGAATHLLRRAGFCPIEAEIRRALDDGPGATVDRLLEDTPDSPRHDELDALGERIARRNDIDALRAWWLLRMTHTSRPLHARMSVFWHDHFATSYQKVASAELMLAQLRLIERGALGRLGALLGGIARDPAMIVWLDGNDNMKGRPNENFARELFELFALGVGNYTETDVREAARAFTGWHQRDGAFRFVATEHDRAAKRVLGVAGPLDGDDVIRVVLDRPACARFIADKILREVLCPDPPADLTDALAGVLRDSGYHVGEALRTLLRSDAMFDPRWRRARIKSPVELSVGMIRSLESSTGSKSISRATSEMGQRLFEPPSVAGWDDHRAWLNTATMLVRLNSAVRVAEADRLRPAALRERYDAPAVADAIRLCVGLTLDDAMPRALSRRIDALEFQDPDQAVRGALRLLMTSPEYQMA